MDVPRHRHDGVDALDRIHSTFKLEKNMTFQVTPSYRQGFRPAVGERRLHNGKGVERLSERI